MKLVADHRDEMFEQEEIANVPVPDFFKELPYKSEPVHVTICKRRLFLK